LIVIAKAVHEKALLSVFEQSTASISPEFALGLEASRGAFSAEILAEQRRWRREVIWGARPPTIPAIL
jgi:hypothetical protein